jgi:hypothetical protein
VRNSGGVTRRFRGGGVKEDATAYLKKNGIDGIALLFEVNARKPNGSRAVSTKTMGGFTFKGDGHPAQSMYLMVKKEGDANSAYVNTGITYSDH